MVTINICNLSLAMNYFVRDGPIVGFPPDRLPMPLELLN